MSQPSAVIRTLASKLGEFDKRIETAIQAAVDGFPHFKDVSFEVRFDTLIMRPLKGLEEALSAEGPFLLMLDALDECGNPNTRAKSLKALGNGLSSLPPVVRVFIASRPTDDIVTAFGPLSSNIKLYDLETSPQDISNYLTHEMEIIRTEKKLGLHWPGTTIIGELTSRAHNLFIWASTALKFINSYKPQSRLDLILSGKAAPSAQSALDAIYRTALQEVGTWDNAEFKTDFRAVMGMILFLQQPLTCSAMDQLLAQGDGECQEVVKRLACVLVYSEEPKLPVRLLHPSFADFLFCKTRCAEDIWHFDPDLYHPDFAIRCLHRLSSGPLKMNMGDLTLSENFGMTVTLPEDVEYACLFWVKHICLVKTNIQSVMEVLDKFVHRHLLHWFDAMSLLGRSKDTSTLLNDLSDWITVSSPLIYFIITEMNFL